MRRSIGAINRSMFANELVSTWLPAAPELHARLQSLTEPRLFDVGCGTGWSSIALARVYPRARIDASSIEEARQHAAEAGVADRVRFEVRDASGLTAEQPYDLVSVFEVVHDMAHPVEMLRRVRTLLIAEGSLLVADERVADAFTSPGDFAERSCTRGAFCIAMPATRAEDPSVEAGAVLRASTLQRYASETGFAHVEVLPVQNDFWRFLPLAAVGTTRRPRRASHAARTAPLGRRGRLYRALRAPSAR